MKNGLLFLLYLSCGIAAYSQNRKEAKLHQLLKQKNYVKLIKKSKNLLNKDRNNVHANYAMSTYYFIRFTEAKNQIGRKKQLSKLFRYWKRVSDYENPFTLQFNDSLHALLVLLASDSSQKPYINNQYRNWLLEYFNDSVPMFHSTTPHLILMTDSAKIRDSLRLAMLYIAKELEGVPYKWAGTNPKGGFDCSGFTQYVYKQIGIEIPHNAQMQSNLSNTRVGLTELQAGDLVFFGYWSGDKQNTVHAGIVFDVTNDEITVIHCVSNGVKIEGNNSSWDHYWKERFLFGIGMDNLIQERIFTSQ